MPEEKEHYLYRKMIMALYSGKKIKYLWLKWRYERMIKKNGNN